MDISNDNGEGEEGYNDDGNGGSDDNDESQSYIHVHHSYDSDVDDKGGFSTGGVLWTDIEIDKPDVATDNTSLTTRKRRGARTYVAFDATMSGGEGTSSGRVLKRSHSLDPSRFQSFTNRGR